METLFIDFDGTICHDRFWRSLRTVENKQVQDYLFSEKNSLVTDWMRGKYSSEEINARVAKETGLNYQYLWETFVYDCNTMTVRKELLELIYKLRIRFHVVLITGNMDCFSRFTVPSLLLNQYFDVIVNSYNEKQLKTDDDGSSFIKYVKGDIGNAYLVEDSITSCAIFKKLGGTAYTVTGTEDMYQCLLNLSTN